MRRKVLPPVLGPAFHVADAAALGIPRSRLRGRDLTTPFRAVRARAATIDVSRRLEERILEAAHHYGHRMTEHEFFSGITAAVIWGVPLPHAALSQTLEVSVHSPRRAPRSRGIRGHEVAPALATYVTHDSGLRVTSPATTWAMLGGVLRHPYDLVAVGDAIVREPWRKEHPPTMATVDELHAATRAGRRIGVANLRACLPRIRTRSASRTETWMRLALVDAGFTEPDLNFDVVERGRWLACVDGAWPNLKIAFEFEGRQHLFDSVQWSRDIARYEALVAAGWIVIRVTWEDLRDRPGVFAQRVRHALHSRL